MGVVGGAGVGELPHSPTQMETLAVNVAIEFTLTVKGLPVPSKFEIVYFFPTPSFPTKKDVNWSFPSVSCLTTVTWLMASSTPFAGPVTALKVT